MDLESIGWIKMGGITVEKYDVRYSLIEKSELENVHELGKYSFCEKGENAYILSIGNHRFITL